MDYLTKQQQPQIDFQNNPILRSIVAPKIQYKRQENFSPAMNAALDTLSVAQQNSYDKQYLQAKLNQYNQMSDSMSRNNNFIQELAQRQRQFDAKQQLDSQQFDRSFDQKNQHFYDAQRLQSQQFDRNMDFNEQQLKQKYSQTTTSDMSNRGKMFDDYYKGNYSKDELDYLDDDSNEALKSQLKYQYAQTGVFPRLEKYQTNGWIGKNDNYRLAQENKQTPQYQTTQSDSTPQDDEDVRFKKWLERQQK